MTDYQSAAKKAEEAVASMKDQKLKEIAFAQILAQLLSPGKPSRTRGDLTSGEHRVREAAPGQGKKKAGTISFLRDLANEGYFKTPRNVKAILDELAGHSHHLRGSDLTWPLQQLCHDKVLRRKKMAPEADKPAVWHWSDY
jgi:hypothetical protein